MKSAARRRLLVESLEARLPFDAAAMGPPEELWQQVVVSFRNDVENPRAAAQAVLGPLNGQLGHVYEHALQGFSAQLPAAAAAALANHPAIGLVEVDLVMRASTQSLPTGVDRIDSEVNATGGLIGSGKQIGVDIAVIDTGIAPHSELNVVGGRRFYTNNSGPMKTRGSGEDDNYADDNGHGTHVAGIAAAKDDGQGIVGVAPGARLWAVKVLDASGNGTMSDIIKGVDWVTSKAGEIEVANMSLGGTGKSDLLRTAIQNSVDMGIVYVVAAGNDWADIHGSDKTFETSDDMIPAAYPEVATISAFADSDGLPGGLGPATSWGEHGRDDAWWGPSNFSNSDEAVNVTYLAANPVQSPGLGIDLVLPGADIRSTWLNGGYHTISGTSMAAPHAAGLAALHMAQHNLLQSGVAQSGRANEVYAIRQSLIDGGRAWASEQGLTHTWGPDKYADNLGWAGGSLVVAPTVDITSPASGAVISGIVSLAGTASPSADGNALTSVALLVNGVETGTPVVPDSSGNWTLSWDSTAVSADNTKLYADGDYELTVRVTDAVGHEGTDKVSVLLNNVEESPTVSILSPAAGAEVSGLITLVAAAEDDVKVTSVTFYLKGPETVQSATATENVDGTWSWSWDTRSITGPANYTVWAVASDGVRETPSASVSIVVDNSVASMSATIAGTATAVNRNVWQAHATVTITDSAAAVLAGATVTGHWSHVDGSVVGTTSSDGTVTFSSENLRVSSTDFTVDDVQLTGYQFTGPVTTTISSTQIQSQSGSGSTAQSTTTSTGGGASSSTPAAEAVDALLAESSARPHTSRVPQAASTRPEPAAAVRTGISDEDALGAALEAYFLTAEIGVS